MARNSIVRAIQGAVAGVARGVPFPLPTMESTETRCPTVTGFMILAVLAWLYFFPDTGAFPPMLVAYVGLPVATAITFCAADTKSPVSLDVSQAALQSVAAGVATSAASVVLLAVHAFVYVASKQSDVEFAFMTGEFALRVLCIGVVGMGVGARMWSVLWPHRFLKGAHPCEVFGYPLVFVGGAMANTAGGIVAWTVLSGEDVSFVAIAIAVSGGLDMMRAWAEFKRRCIERRTVVSALRYVATHCLIAVLLMTFLCLDTEDGGRVLETPWGNATVPSGEILTRVIQASCAGVAGAIVLTIGVVIQYDDGCARPMSQ